MHILIDLFLTFGKIGLFTFGGGYAMIALMEHICVEEKKWLSHGEMMDLVAIAESTPGPNAINCATYTGYRMAGMIGAITTTVAITLPAFLIIYAISLFFDDFLEIVWVANAFRGIKLGVGILIFDVAINMIKKMQKKPFPRCIMVCAALLTVCIQVFSLRISSVTLMLAAALLSLAVFVVQEKMGGGEK